MVFGAFASSRPVDRAFTASMALGGPVAAYLGRCGMSVCTGVKVSLASREWVGRAFVDAMVHAGLYALGSDHEALFESSVMPEGEPGMTAYAVEMALNSDSLVVTWRVSA